MVYVRVYEYKERNHEVDRQYHCRKYQKKMRYL